MCNIMRVTFGLHTAPMADTADGCKSNFVLENLIGKTFPKGYHLFGSDERQAGTYTITDFQVLARRVPPLAYPGNSSCWR